MKKEATFTCLSTLVVFGKYLLVFAFCIWFCRDAIFDSWDRWELGAVCSVFLVLIQSSTQGVASLDLLVSPALIVFTLVYTWCTTDAVYATNPVVLLLLAFRLPSGQLVHMHNLTFSKLSWHALYKYLYSISMLLVPYLFPCKLVGNLLHCCCWWG